MIPRVNCDGISTIATTSHRVKSTTESTTTKSKLSVKRKRQKNYYRSQQRKKRKVDVQNYISVSKKPATSKEPLTSTTYEYDRLAGTFSSSSRSSRTIPSPATELFHQQSCKRRKQRRQWEIRFHKIMSVTVREHMQR